MSKSAHEPPALIRGKRFHTLVQREWRATAEGDVRPERAVDLREGGRGRVDVFVDVLGEGLVTVVEVKSTDWDRMDAANVRRNVRRHIRQVWRYIESQLDLRGMSVCAGLIYPRLPSDAARTALIETMCEAEGIQVVWHNESIADVRERTRHAKRRPT